MKRWLISGAAVIVVLGVGLYWWRDIFVRQVFAPTEQSAEPGATLTESSPAAIGENSLLSVETVAQDLAIPWEVAWLPTGELLVTERPGRLLKIGADKSVIAIAGVAAGGEGGLQGMALHPQFAANHFIYLYLTTRTSGGLTNRVDRYRLEGVELQDRMTIIDGIPGAQLHDGGRIAFGPTSAEASTFAKATADKSTGKPDYYLYITTGDAGTPAAAQDTKSLAGKILRVKDDGTIPADNPFGNAVYSYGHRNPQGLAWDSAGRLWSTEHGRSGVSSGFDEINLIVPGGNYGWPDSEGDTVQADTRAPVLHSGATTTWAPAGAAVVGDRLIFSGLRGEALYSLTIAGETVADLTAHFAGEFGRLRAVKVGPDGHLYITTSNTDGRGTERPGDDKVIRIHPDILTP